MKTLLLIGWGFLFLVPAAQEDQSSGMIVIVQSCQQWKIENRRDVSAEIHLGHRKWTLAAKEQHYLLPPSEIPQQLHCTWTDGLKQSVDLKSNSAVQAIKSPLP